MSMQAMPGGVWGISSWWYKKEVGGGVPAGTGAGEGLTSTVVGAGRLAEATTTWRDATRERAKVRAARDMARALGHELPCERCKGREAQPDTVIAMILKLSCYSTVSLSTTWLAACTRANAEPVA